MVNKSNLQRTHYEHFMTSLSILYLFLPSAWGGGLDIWRHLSAVKPARLTLRHRIQLVQNLLWHQYVSGTHCHLKCPYRSAHWQNIPFRSTLGWWNCHLDIDTVGWGFLIYTEVHRWQEVSYPDNKMSYSSLGLERWWTTANGSHWQQLAVSNWAFQNIWGIKHDQISTVLKDKSKTHFLLAISHQSHLSC